LIVAKESKPVKICYAINEYNSKTDTHYNACYDLLEQVSKQAEVFCIFEKKSGYDQYPFGNYYILKSPFVVLKFIESLMVLTYLRLKGYKIFYSHYTVISRLTMPLVARLTGAKSYHWHCGLFGLFIKPWSIHTLKDKLLNELPETLSWTLNTYLVTGAKAVAHHYHNEFKVPLKKILIFPNFVDDAHFKPRKKNQARFALHLPQEKKIILFVHRIVERKGAHFLVDIAQNILKKQKDVLFVVVGDGPYMEMLQQRIKENTLTSFFRIEGKIANSQLTNYYSSADVFILPSLEEGFPRVLVECMAVGTKFVAFDIGAVRDITPQSLKPYVVKTGDVTSFSKALFKSIHQSISSEELISFVKERYTLKKAVGNFLNLFK